MCPCLPKIFNFPFTYNSKIEGKLGNLVEVPFGSKKEIGVIWKKNYLEPKGIKIKDITKKTDYSIDKKLIDFIEWFSIYNMVPIGLVLKMAIGNIDKFLRVKDNLVDFKLKHWAALIFLCLLAAIFMPVPEPQIKIPTFLLFFFTLFANLWA